MGVASQRLLIVSLSAPKTCAIITPKIGLITALASKIIKVNFRTEK
jgi:hypothetical protein